MNDASSDLVVARNLELVVGTANLDQEYGIGSFKLTRNEFKEILNLNSYRFEISVDTSPSYGQAETICNELVRRGEKVYSKRRYVAKKRSFEPSNLNESIRVIELVHNWEELVDTYQTDALNHLEKRALSGAIDGFGVSTYGDFNNIVGLDPIPTLVIQAPLNVLNQNSITKFKEIKSRFKNTRILARSIFLQGLLTKETSQSTFSSHEHILRFKQFCAEAGVTSLEACLEFVRAQQSIDGIVIGVTSLHEMEQVIEILGRPKSKSLIDFDWSTLKSDDLELIDPRKW